MSESDAFETIAAELGRAIAPLNSHLSSPDGLAQLLRELGWPDEELPTTLLSLAAPMMALNNAIQPVLDGQGLTAQELGSLTQAIEGMYSGVLSALQSGLPQTLIDAGFASEFPFQLFSYLLIQYLIRYHRRILFCLQLIGVVRRKYVPPFDSRPSYFRQELAVPDVPQLLSDPGLILERAYGWRTREFDAERVLVDLRDCLSVLGIRSRMQEPSREGVYSNSAVSVPPSNGRLTLDVPIFSRRIGGADAALGVRVVPVTTQGSLLPGLALLPYAEGVVGLQVRLTEQFIVAVQSSLGLQGGLGIVVRPGLLEMVDSFDDASRSTRARGEVSVGLNYSNPDSEPTILIGSARASRFEVGSASAQLGVRLDASSAFDAYIELALQDARLSIQPGEGDGFLRSILPRDGIGAKFDVVIGVATARGFYFRGSGTLQFKLPTRIELPGVTFESIVLAVTPRTDRVSAHVGATVQVRIGPVCASIQNLGVHVDLAFPSTTGNLGPFQLEIGFKSPEGVGVAAEAGPVIGGGFIAYDANSGRYTGALSLSISEVALHAVGIVDTHASGVSGYSFLIAISAEFTPIQLGMGFTLNGVGGICGIQRAVSSRALQEGVRNGSLAPLLFPRDPIGQASQLVTGLQRVFPPTNDRYVFGPMFKIGWGTPTLVTVDLGIIIQLPSPIIIALIGQISAAFPDPDAAVVVLHIDISGTLDTGEKTLAISASLHDSRVASFTLSGDMALRLSWGDKPDFALSIGGFNKAYKPPPGFPELRRLTLALCEGNNPRITLAAYLAVTSNSFQFGARAELYAEAAGFNVYGYLEFNALVIFRPFSFRFDFAAGLALRRGTSAIMSIAVSGVLTGPTPWHVQGSASISILFFEISVSFDATFGESPHEIQIETVDPWPLLEAAVRDLKNWVAALPGEGSRVVSFADPGASDAPLRLDPVGTLNFRQRVMPLDRKINRYGEKRVAAPTTFHLEGTRVGTSDGQASLLKENFAPGQFQQLTDAEKLSQPSFELMNAGASFGVETLDPKNPIETDLAYKTFEAHATTPLNVLHVPDLVTLSAAHGTSASALAPMRTGGDRRFAPPPGASPLVSLGDEQMVIVDAATLRPARFGGAAATVPTSSSGEAHDALQDRLRAHPEERGMWRVIPLHEAR